MSTAAALDAGVLEGAVRGFRDALASNQDLVNRLNVYPVPDGDTGTNMALTAESVVGELAAASDAAASDAAGSDAAGSDGDAGGLTLAAACRAISHGSLMGARGNSGIILSQILRGFTGSLSALPVDAPDASAVVDAMVQASNAARQAVVRPVEGTILTVMTAAAEASRNHLRDEPSATLGGVLDAARSGAVSALAKTPDLLPVLAESGVVDAGGAGLVLFFDALVVAAGGKAAGELISLLPDAVAGRMRKALTEAPAASRAPAGPGAHAVEVAEAIAAVGELRYEVMFLLEAEDAALDAFKDVWAGIGDSIVVVGGEGLWNCHIHTGDIGAAIEAGIDTGRPMRIKVTDLAEQVEEEHWVRQAEESEAAAPQPSAHTGPSPVTAVVAVATGEGLRRIFHSLGVHAIVTGGQSMNPSTAELLAAVEGLDAGAVVILPNNKNIIPVANEVDALTKKSVRVVPTVSIVEGFAALLEYDPEAGPGENAQEMLASAKRVVAGEVTQAVRDASSAAGPIAAGDWLGLSAEGIQVVRASLAEAACALLEHLVAETHEIVTVIEGEGATVADTRQITEWIAEHLPQVVVETHHGGQPLYPYLFSID